MASTDMELVARVLQEDDEAFAELVRRYQSPLRAWLRRLTGGDTGQADDLAQETFLRAYRRLGSFRATGKFSTWLFGIAFNQFRNYARARRDFVPLDQEVADNLIARSPAETVWESWTDLTPALESLSLNQRAAITLCFQQGMTLEEAAAVLQCPLGTVKTNILRAKQRLRRYFHAEKSLAIHVHA